MSRYKKFFEEDGQCDCEKCDKKEACDKKKKESIEGTGMICESCKLPEIEVEEDCPGKTAGGGSCANADNSAKLKGVCAKDYGWSASAGKCMPKEIKKS